MSKREQQAKIDPNGTGWLPGLAIDCVIFGFHQNQLKILLLEYENTDLFALPGGFIKEKENVNDAAKRVLTERTSLKNIYLEQFYTFGNLARYDVDTMRTILIGKKIDPIEHHWLLKRFVSVSYYALVDFTKAIPTPDLLSDNCEWYDLASLPTLMLDHEQIVQKALETLRVNLDHKLVGSNLLPETFTMRELQNLYETILNQKLVRTNFQRKMLSLGILERVAKKMTGGAHRAPYLYRFSSTKEKK